MTIALSAEEGARAERLRRDLAGHLADQGDIRTAEWREAFESVPRHVFVPRFFTQNEDGTWVTVDGSDPADRDRWLAEVYSDQTLITQLAEEALPPELGGGVFSMWTSSSTVPSLMARMLGDLEVEDGHRVLEIGTGSGYNAALLSHRLGDHNVTSVDISPELVTAATDRLARIGYAPQLVTGDGAMGVPADEPYDRIIATCAVPVIPPAWLDQTRTGGIILTDLRGRVTGALVKLHKQPDGSATGRFPAEGGGFMYLRHTDQAITPPPDELSANPLTERTTTMDPGLITGDPRFLFLTQLCLPQGKLIRTQDDDGNQAVQISLPDGSWCKVDRNPTNGRYHLTEAGPTPIWERIEDAHDWWNSAGQPSWDRYGLTATGTEQFVWYDNPESTHRWVLT